MYKLTENWHTILVSERNTLPRWYREREWKWPWSHTTQAEMDALLKSHTTISHHPGCQEVNKSVVECCELIAMLNVSSSLSIATCNQDMLAVIRRDCSNWLIPKSNQRMRLGAVT